MLMTTIYDDHQVIGSI